MGGISEYTRLSWLIKLVDVYTVIRFLCSFYLISFKIKHFFAPASLWRICWQTTYSILSTIAVSSRVCSQLKIIIFLSYFDNWFPRSLSTSLMVKAWFRSFCPNSADPVAPVVPGTSNVVPEALCAALATASNWSKLNSLCESRSKARYVVNNLQIVKIKR